MKRINYELTSRAACYWAFVDHCQAAFADIPPVPASLLVVEPCLVLRIAITEITCIQNKQTNKQTNKRASKQTNKRRPTSTLFCAYNGRTFLKDM